MYIYHLLNYQLNTTKQDWVNLFHWHLKLKKILSTLNNKHKYATLTIFAASAHVLFLRFFCKLTFRLSFCMVHYLDDQFIKYEISIAVSSCYKELIATSLRHLFYLNHVIQFNVQSLTSTHILHGYYNGVKMVVVTNNCP